jgi:hypothetical protein
VITSRYAESRYGFGSHGSNVATRRQQPKNPVTDQPYGVPDEIIEIPMMTNTADTTTVNNLIGS